MKVLMASTSFPRDSQDWRGRFILDMAKVIAAGLGQLDLWAPPSSFLPLGVNSVLTTTDAEWLDKLATRGGLAHLLRTKPLAGIVAAADFLYRLNRACRGTSADVYHINWLQTALALPTDSRPAVITILGSDYGILRIPGMVPLVRQCLKKRKAILMPNASWMQPSLSRQFGDLAEVRPNPFGVENRLFEIARTPTSDGEDWLVVSRLTRAKLGHLLSWGDGLFDDRRRLHLFGPMQETVTLPAWVKYHGPTHPSDLRERWFPIATGLITLSQHSEGRPQIMLEAMAAGLPVIASDLPAHANFVRHNETGWLVGSRDEFANILERFSPELAADISQRAQAWTRHEIGTWSDYGARCLWAYKDLLARA